MVIILKLLILILILLWVHLIADFVLQDDFQATMKGKNRFIMLVHAAIWAGAICVAIYFMGLFAWWKLIMLLVGHFIIDTWKATKSDKTYALTRDLWIDQSLHFVQLLLCLI